MSSSGGLPTVSVGASKITSPPCLTHHADDLPKGPHVGRQIQSIGRVIDTETQQHQVWLRFHAKRGESLNGMKTQLPTAPQTPHRDLFAHVCLLLALAALGAA
jgi:hypothetical protein